MAHAGGRGAALVLGFPGRLAVALTEHLLSFRPRAVVYVLVPSGLSDGEALVAASFSRHRERVRFLNGDFDAVDFGLSGVEYLELLAHVSSVHHCLGLSAQDEGKADARSTRARERLVSAMREVLALCRALPQVDRLVVYSSLSVSGAHAGEFAESDLNVGQKFDSPFEEGLAIAERMARSQSSALPIVILRAGQLAPLSLLAELLRSQGTFHVPAVLNGGELWYLTPFEHIVRCGVFLAGTQVANGTTVHLIESRPPTVREALFLVAKLAGRPLPVFGAAPLNWLSNPRFGRAARVERAYLHRLRVGLRYGAENAERLLESAGLSCPAFEATARCWLEAPAAHDDSLRAAGQAAS